MIKARFEYTDDKKSLILNVTGKTDEAAPEIETRLRLFGTSVEPKRKPAEVLTVSALS